VAFTCFVLATDGASAEPAYILLTLLLILIPSSTCSLSPAGLADPAGRRSRARGGRRQRRPGGFVCWALIDRYPHPNEPGLLEYTVLVLLTPILSAVTLLRSRPCVVDGAQKRLLLDDARGGQPGGNQPMVGLFEHRQFGNASSGWHSASSPWSRSWCCARRTERPTAPLLPG